MNAPTSIGLRILARIAIARLPGGSPGRHPPLDVPLALLKARRPRLKPRAPLDDDAPVQVHHGYAAVVPHQARVGVVVDPAAGRREHGRDATPGGVRG